MKTILLKTGNTNVMADVNKVNNIVEVRIGENLYSFEVLNSSSGILLKLGDQIFSVSLAEEPDNKYSLVANGISTEIFAEEISSVKDGNQDKLNQPKFNLIKSPVFGVISYIKKEGSFVKKGENLLIITSMKMENKIFADDDLRIKKTYYGCNEKVSEDEIILEVEAQ